MKILTLFVRHGAAKYIGAEDTIDAIFASQMPHTERRTIIIDNALPMFEVKTSHTGHTILGGDNSHWEFSAWDHALSHIGDDIWDYDLVNLVTSAFNTLYTNYLERFDMKMLSAVSARNVCLGHIDCFNAPVQLGLYHSQHWLRTSFLFIPPTELKGLGTVVSLDRLDDIFTNNPDQPFLPKGPLSENYKELILSWLTGHGTGQGVQWHSRFKLDEGSLQLFKQKTMAIINEHMFSIRLRALGCRLIDTTWLATVLSQQSASQIPWDTLWTHQLAQRDRDSLVVN